jgi:integrase
MRFPSVLTDAAAARIRPRAREFTVHDKRLQGFGLRVRPSGAKSWVLRLSDGDGRRRITLGATDALSVEEALAQAHALMADAGAASPPATAPRSKRASAAAASQPAAPLLGEMAAAFVEARRGSVHPKTFEGIDGYVTGFLVPAFGGRRMDSLTTPELATWFYAYSRDRPQGANRALRHFRAMIHWARETGRLDDGYRDPSSPIRRNPERPRGSMLTGAQLDALGAVLNDPPPSCADAADVVRLTLLTGCRSGEILRLRWVEVQKDRLMLGHTKTGPRTVLLVDAAKAVLRRRSGRKDGPWVFPGRGDATRPRTQIHGAWARLRAAAGIPDTVRLHDLRHTYASQALLQGETLAMAGQLLGHRSTASTERYAHLDGGYLAEAAERCAARVAALLG